MGFVDQVGNPCWFRMVHFFPVYTATALYKKSYWIPSHFRTISSECFIEQKRISFQYNISFFLLHENKKICGLWEDVYLIFLLLL